MALHRPVAAEPGRGTCNPEGASARQVHSLRHAFPEGRALGSHNRHAYRLDPAWEAVFEALDGLRLFQVPGQVTALPAAL